MSTNADPTRRAGAVSSVINGKNITVDPPAGSAEPLPAGEPPAAYRFSSGDAPSERSEADRPRIVEEHHIVGPHGEDEIEAVDDQGRHWYHLS